MVSFQCNGCGDVLTKPKLDKHQAMCRKSFDCIDCSKRFETPADYKGHTSCISEAEKYQKGLYNGGKQSGPEGTGRNQRSWPQGGGGRQWGNNRGQWQQRNVNRATGANDTPLGTPVRMSPVNDIPVVKEDSKESEPTAKTPKKRKAETETTESKDASEPAKKKKKKQKAVEDSRETTEASFAKVKSRTERKSEVAIVESPPQDTNSQSEECGNTTQEMGEKKTKKKKRESKEKEPKGDGEEVKKEKKDKRKKKEDPSPSGQELESAAMADTNPTLATQPSATEASLTINPEETQPTKKSKSKKSKSKLKAAATDEAPDVTTSATFQPTTAEVAGVPRDDQGNGKKKRRSGNLQEENGDAKRVARGNSDTPEEKLKEKKKKRKSGGQTVCAVE